MSLEKNMELSFNSLSSRDFSTLKLNWQQKNQSVRNLSQTIKTRPHHSFLVRIPHQSYQQQNSIYQWRLGKPSHVLALTQYTLLPNFKTNNNRILAKVTVQPYSCTISQLSQITLTKCIKLLKEVLEGSLTLMEKFGIKIIKSNNILINEEGQARVWLHENMEINPYKFEEDQQHLVCWQLIKIFKGICLKTKLSNQFFEEIQKIEKLTNLLKFACSFESNQNLSTLAISKRTTSTALTNSFQHLKFSDGNSSKRKKKNMLKVQSLPYFSEQLDCQSLFSQTSIKRSKFINEERVQSQYLTNKQDQKIQVLSPKYSTTTYMTHTNAGSGFLSPSTEKVKKSEVTGSKLKNHSSFVISEIYQDDSVEKIQVSDELIKDKKMKSQIRQKSVRDPNCFGSAQMLNEGWSTSLAFPKVEKINEDYSDQESNKFSQRLGQSKRLSEFREETLKSQIVQDEAFYPFQIIAKNGWSNDLVKLLNNSTLKESFTLGKEQNKYLHNINLAKLDRLGRNIIQSFLPVEEEEYSYEL